MCEPVPAGQGNRRLGGQVFNHVHQTEVHDAGNLGQRSKLGTAQKNVLTTERTSAQHRTLTAHATVSAAEVALGQIAEIIANPELPSLPGDSLIHIELLDLLEADAACAVIPRASNEVQSKFVVAPQALQSEAAQCASDRMKGRATESVGHVRISRLAQMQTRLQVAQRRRMRLQSRLIDSGNRWVLADWGCGILLAKCRRRCRLRLLAAVRRSGRGLRAAILCPSHAQREG